jgi:hypothetical protein
MNFLVTNFQSKSVKLNKFKETGFFFFNEYDERFVLEDTHLFYLKGYLLKDKEPLTSKFTNELNNTLGEKWPYPDHFSGSFGLCFIYKKNEVTIANDCIGFYPIYFYYDKETLAISNNLTLIQSVLKCQIDEIGLFQRKHAPEYSALGRRTMLKGVKRLLPGEKITFDILKKNFSSFFDNRLYGDIKSSNINNLFITEFWKNYEAEVIGASKLNEKPINIALSGGMDSRLVLGAMSNKKSKAFTYGENDSYEVKISKRLSRVKNIKFISKFDKKNYFPSKEELIKTIAKSGPPSVMSFFDILDLAPEKREILLFGDMCESLPARNIKKFSSRKSRQKNFINNFILNKAYKLTKSNSKDFLKWKNAKIETFKKKLIKNTKSYNIIDLDELIDYTLNDLISIIKRVEEHDIRYTELYDELFSWYTHARIPMSKQILHCDSSFYALSPSMGSDVLIRTSNIHPNDRLNYRLMNKLFKKIDKLHELNYIPTSQSPLISRNSPEVFQFMIWGLRSKSDQFLIKRLMKNKNPKLRYRVFKSLNWVDIYQQENLENRIREYFKNNLLGTEYLNSVLNKTINRKNLNSWPLTNIDIMAISILNLELDILVSLNSYNKS